MLIIFSFLCQPNYTFQFYTPNYILPPSIVLPSSSPFYGLNASSLLVDLNDIQGISKTVIPKKEGEGQYVTLQYTAKAGSVGRWTFNFSVNYNDIYFP